MSERGRLIQATMTPLALVAWFIWSSSAIAVPALLPPQPHPTTNITCIPRERDALLAFKDGLTDPSNYLSSWRLEDDCCWWPGVECSYRTGHVVGLDVNSGPDSYDEIVPGAIGGQISSSLLTLRHLKHLDLSYNNFSGSPIPEFIGGLRSLKHLTLTSSSFGGRIPPHLGNLSHLVSLDLSFQIHGFCSPDLTWLSRLRKLQHLGMSEADLSANVHWADVVNMLPSLVTLELAACGLQNTMPLPLHSNLTSLDTLQLGLNSFNSSFGANYLAWDLPMLTYLDLGNCGIQSPIPDEVGNLTSIELLDLSTNNFSGMVPLTFKKLKNLQLLELSENFISGDTEDLFHRLPTDELQELSLGYNNLRGSLPDRLEQFNSLLILKLSNNKLSGEIPVGIQGLTNLEELWLDSNNLHGTITEDHFINMTSLKVLLISNNPLTILVDRKRNTLLKLTSASFSSCILGPRFPTWISQPTIIYLDISNTSIHDSIPDEFWISMYHAEQLYLSRNQIFGRLPAIFRFAGTKEFVLDISSNQLAGPIPTLPKNLVYLDLSGNNLSGTLPLHIGTPKLQTLMLFKNSFSGTIPCSLFELKELKFLDLSDNLLNGTMPNCLRAPKFSSITMLNLNNNILSGEFPSFLQRCKELKFLDLACNKFTGSLPTWIWSKLPYLAFLRLRSNMISGGIPEELTKMKGLQYLDIASNNISGNIPLSLGNLIAMAHTPNQQGTLFKTVNSFVVASIYKSPRAYTDSLWVVTKGQQLEYTTGIVYMVNIDFSCNNLTGQIPQGIGMLVALKNLNLSWNHLSGVIPQTIGELRAVESLDLSHNELSREIPTSLGNLTTLAHLNLSYNNLTGTIPSGNQLRTLEDQPSIYIGNPGLCGPPVSRNCSRTETPTRAPEDEHEGMCDALSLYLGIGTGFVAGLWIVFCGFLLKKNWRIRWFSSFDSVYDWVYVQVALRWASLSRKTK
ncbi:receptor-like protein EIX2 [Hordeum vulgare subsp. vulgare]|uniref:Leucine-rich repeat-containing N-terminal plant-type domain-containing protein n=1 Tax=Hordeum vulgare subsp. vulgare TaxID=112509 RepID=A0A8I6Y4A9_HORVV|nr:receptor-like protein EIX2 [Hordeum vulgare subsp. vulgare]